MPRTETTKRLEYYKYQFYQWFYVDKYSISQVTALFHWLFSILNEVTGKENGVTKKQWLSRQREWNKKWQLQKSGICEPPPEDLIGQRAWFRRRDDGLLLLDTSLLPEYTRHKKPEFIKKVDLDDAAIGRDCRPQQSSQNPSTGDHALGHSPSIADHDLIPGTFEDAFVGTPELHEDSVEARNIYGFKPQTSPQAKTDMDPSAGCFPPTPYCGNSEPELGSEVSDNSLLYPGEGPVSQTSSAHQLNIGSKRLDNAMNEPSSSSYRSRPSSHKRAQGTSFTASLPTRNNSSHYFLPSNHADTGFAGMMADPATLDAFQPMNDAASYSTGRVLASSNITPLHPPSMPYFCPPATSPGLLPDNHPSVHDVGLAPDNYGSLVLAARSDPLSHSRGTAASPLVASQYPAQLLETNAEVFSHTHIVGPYPRRPSNQPSFLRYDRN